jgi:thiol-disulfide isomerase/thioredoxin
MAEVLSAIYNVWSLNGEAMMPSLRWMPFFLSIGCVPVLESGEKDSAWEAPENSWPMGEPPAELDDDGFEQGDVARDLRMLDQNGEEVSLWQFYGMVVLLDISAEWCAPCRNLAEETQETQDDYEDQGFIYLTLLGEDNQGDTPVSEAVLDLWAEDFGLTTPVVSDLVDHRTELVGYPTSSYPRILVIDRAMTVAVDNVIPQDSEVRNAIESVL